MTDWIDETEAACKTHFATARCNKADIELGKVARTALPRALAALRAADEVIKALELHKEGLGGQAYIPEAEIAAYRKARL